MSLVVLERNKQKQTGSRIIKAGQKLFCYEESYGFTVNRYYRISEINEGYITVKDDEKMAVIFANVEELKNVFMIIYE